MTSIVDRAISKGLAAHKRAAGVSVVYYVDADTSIAVTAIVGRTRTEAQGQDGFTVHSEQRNYLIDAADLAIDGTPVEPSNGHWITHNGRRFEVQPEIPGQKPWRWSDRNFERLRIETREVNAL